MRRRDKTKTGDSMDIADIEPEGSSYNERNIDHEIEVRNASEVSQSNLRTAAPNSTDRGDSQAVLVASSSSLQTRIEESKISTASFVPTSQSNCAAAPSPTPTPAAATTTATPTTTKTVSTSGSSSSIYAAKMAFLGSTDPPELLQGAGATNEDAWQKLRVTRYPAYPPVDISGPTTDNAKPLLHKKGSSDGLISDGWHKDGSAAEDSSLSLAPSTKMHLKRLEEETAMLRQREAEQQRQQERNAAARRRVEAEFQKTQQELEEEEEEEGEVLGLAQTPAALRHGPDITHIIADSRQKYAEYINSQSGPTDAQSDLSTSSDYSSMRSTLDKSSSVDYSPKTSLPADLNGSNHYTPSSQSQDSYSKGFVPPQRPETEVGRIPGSHRTSREGGTYFVMSSAGSLASQKPCTHDDMELYRTPSGRRGRMPAFDHSKGSFLATGSATKDSTVSSGSKRESLEVSADEKQRRSPRPRKGSLDSLLDFYDTVSSDGEGEGGDLLKSIVASYPQYHDLLSKSPPTPVSRVRPPHLPDRPGRDKSTFQDPSLHKKLPANTGDSRVVSTASRFERQAVGLRGQRSLPGLIYAKEPQTKQSQGAANQGKSSRQPKLGESISRCGKDNTKDHKVLGHQNSCDSEKNYVSALRKSTEKLFGNQDQLLDISTGVGEQEDTGSLSSRSKQKRLRRHTIGGIDNLASSQVAGGENLAAWERLKPAEANRLVAESRDVQTWLSQQRLRRVGSSPALCNLTLGESLPTPPPPRPIFRKKTTPQRTQSPNLKTPTRMLGPKPPAPLPGPAATASPTLPDSNTRGSQANTFTFESSI